MIALVNRADLVNVPGVQLIEIPDAKRSWLRRMWWEWFGFKKLATQLAPDFWLSLHDITSRVDVPRQAVYCHNPSPFFRMKWREIRLEPKLWLFNRFYALLYRCFIRRNHHVIVQQAWLRDEFVRRFGPLPVVVAHPVAEQAASKARPVEEARRRPFVFVYPALSRVFKNFEIIGEAARLLNRRQFRGFEIRITIDGTENSYARWLQRRFGDVENLHFIGRQTAAQMSTQYDEASALLFPSRLETWGLPITEAKSRGLPMLVADAKYAHETVGTYESVSFFPPDSAEQLAGLMQSMIEGSWRPQGQVKALPAPPYAADWPALWALMTDGLQEDSNSQLATRNQRISAATMIDCPQISLSIVSHGQGHLVRNILEDLRTLHGATFEVIVTLNIPEDKTFLEPYRSMPLRIIENRARKGFGSNHNAAFHQSRGNVFVIVNPDVRAPGFDFRSMLEILKNDKVGACAPIIFSPSGAVEDSARRFPTFLRLAARSVRRRRASDYDLSRSAATPVDWVAGMFVAFRRHAFEKISGFDERYFMYMEDADICQRLRRDGFEIVVDGSASVVHDAQRASRHNVRHLSWHMRSAIRFLIGF